MGRNDTEESGGAVAARVAGEAVLAKPAREGRVRGRSVPFPTRPQGAAATESEDLYRLTIDRNWRITSISDEAARWGGSTPGALLGADSRKRWLLPSRLIEAIEGSFASGELSKVEFASVLIPGRWVEFQVRPSRRGAEIRFEDITERRRTPTEGAEARGVEGGTVEIALLDDRGTIVSVNAAWRAAFAAVRPDIANAGVGADYIDACKKFLPDLDEMALGAQFDALRAGAISHFGATFGFPQSHGQQLRRLQVTRLAIGRRSYFLATYDDLNGWEQATRALQATSDQLLHAQEEERQRIAIELHDSMGQHLAAMALGLTNLRRRFAQDAAALSIIDDMSKVTQQAVRETRVLSHLMNASVQERGGLEASVRRLAEGFGRRAGLDVTFEVSGHLDAVNIATQHAMFRVVQEALSNVHRHARAAAVSVSLLRGASGLTVQIADDGRGFGVGGLDEREAPLGVGIMGMRARIEQLGGKLEIVGGAKRGTVVRAKVPLSSSMHHESSW